MLRTVLLAFSVFASWGAAATDQRAVILKTEFEKILTHVQTLKADGKIGEFMKFKKMGYYEILWDLGQTDQDYDLIRLYREGQDGAASFSIDYYRSRTIVEGRRVIRRFVGPTHLGWRNDTMDYETGEYLGRQGTEWPEMNEGDRRLVKEWQVTLFGEGTLY